MKKLNDIKTSVLARFLGVTPPFVSSVKNGRVNFSTDQSLKISAEFDIPLYELRPDVYPKVIFKNNVKTAKQ
jgi:DNA-binding transcriptional regulator YdaS (Cro superfamily)